VTYNPSFELPRPARFTAGTVGEPGRRVFYLQALGDDGQLVTLKCEKQQVGALAEHLAALLSDLPTAADEEVARTDVGFVEPTGAEWAVGRMGVAWDEDDDRLVLQCEELVVVEVDEDEEDDEPDVEVFVDDDPPATARFRLTRAQVAAFVEVARDLVEAGRPPCYLCGSPMDPSGHACPRWN
jgi:uncharacterized repeat protein (TIGR03847 family)